MYFPNFGDLLAISSSIFSVSLGLFSFWDFDAIHICSFQIAPQVSEILTCLPV
jgi:hypothetical protein